MKRARWWCPLATVGEAELLPRFHGVAYPMWDSMRYRTAIIPLNFVLAAGRWLQRRLVYDWVPDAKRRDAIHDAFVRGYHAGVLAERMIPEQSLQERYRASLDAALNLYHAERGKAKP